MLCTFFGHKDAPSHIKPLLRLTLIHLIKHHHVDLFYVGNQGNFDLMVKKELQQLKSHFPHIDYVIVLAYLPVSKTSLEKTECLHTLYTEILEHTPPKYAISKRNRWMIDQADYVVTYVKYSTGGAATYKELAQKKGKHLVNLADYL